MRRSSGVRVAGVHNKDRIIHGFLTWLPTGFLADFIEEMFVVVPFLHSSITTTTNIYINIE